MVLTKANAMAQKRLGHVDQSRSTPAWSHIPNTSSHVRTRDKFAWSLSSKHKLTDLIEVFSTLVRKLDDLVPLDTDRPKEIEPTETQKMRSADDIVAKMLQRMEDEDFRDFLAMMGPVGDNERC